MNKVSGSITIQSTILQDGVKDILAMKSSYSVGSFSKYLFEFCEEMLKKKESSVSITIPRAAKVVALVDVFLLNKVLATSINIEALKDALLSDIMMHDKSSSFYRSIKDINTLLLQCTKREFSSAEVYFINEKQKNYVINIFRANDAVMNTPTSKKRFDLSRVYNFLNPDNMSNKYYVKPVFSSVYINKIDSVIKYLPSNYAVWKNKTIKEHKELLAAHDFDEKTKERMRAELEVALEYAEEEYQFILNNPQRVNVAISGYNHAKPYPNIFYSFKDTLNGVYKHKKRHLSIEKPNILWFKPEPFREDLTAKEFISGATRAFGDVYYQIKEEE